MPLNIDPPPVKFPITSEKISRPWTTWMSALQNELTSRGVDSERYLNWTPIKVAATKVESDGLGNFTTVDPAPFNVTSVTDNLDGTLDVVITNTTLLGNDLTPTMYASCNVIWTPDVDSGLYVGWSILPAPSANTLRIQLYDFYIAGVNLRVQPYIMNDGDQFHIMIQSNLNLGLDWPA